MPKGQQKVQLRRKKAPKGLFFRQKMKKRYSVALRAFRIAFLENIYKIQLIESVIEVRGLFTQPLTLEFTVTQLCKL